MEIMQASGTSAQNSNIKKIRILECSSCVLMLDFKQVLDQIDITVLVVSTAANILRLLLGLRHASLVDASKFETL